MIKTVTDRQTLLDIALQCGGHIETTMDLATENGLSVTDLLSDGQKLNVPEAIDGACAKIVAQYNIYRIEPATEASAEDIARCPYGGIGEMGIEIDFEIV